MIGTRRGLDRPATVLADDDRLLLQAALADGESAREAWAAVRARVDIDALTGERHRLLPLLGWNLERVGIDPGAEPVLPRLLGLTRRTWLQAQQHEIAAAAAVGVLADAGLDPVVFKGVALGRSAYPALGLRPMEDVDLLVEPGRLPAAVEILLDAGYELRAGPESSHAVAVTSPANHEVDVHAHPGQMLVRPPGALARRRMAERRVVLPGPTGTNLHTLDPADHLLVVLEHGISSPGSAPLRWIADASGLTRNQSIDWTYFVEQVNRFGSAYSVGLALAVLDQVGTADIPAGVGAAVRDVPSTLADRILVTMWRDRRYPSAARSLVVRMNAEAPPHRWRRLPHLVSDTLGVESVQAVPWTVARRSRSYLERCVGR